MRSKRRELIDRAEVILAMDAVDLLPIVNKAIRFEKLPPSWDDWSLAVCNAASLVSKRMIEIVFNHRAARRDAKKPKPKTTTRGK